MLGNGVIAFFAGFGAAMWVYIKFSRRSTGAEFIKNLAPAVVAGIMVFILALSLLAMIP